MKNKKGNYTHIKKVERLEIAILLRRGYSVREIARVLKRSPGTISDEIRKNMVNGGYDSCKAQHKAYVRRKYSKYQGMKIVERSDLREYVETKLHQDWSPEEIAGRIEHVDRYLPYASYGAIYKFVYSVYGRALEQYLRYKGRKRKGKEFQRGTKLQNRTFIEKRPSAIDKRERFGDWEGDFIVSGKDGKGALLVLNERKARYTLLRKLGSRSPEVVNQAISEITGGILLINSLTIDNDISFQKHEELSRVMGIPVYFTHPYHSWEKGGVENANKLIRQYIPKGSDISQYSEIYIKEVELKLNTRPRKCLQYETPLEVMLKHHQLKTLQDIGIVNPIKKAEVFGLRG